MQDISEKMLRVSSEFQSQEDSSFLFVQERKDDLYGKRGIVQMAGVWEQALW